MSSVNLRFIDVSFSYGTSSENIISSLSINFTSGWTGIVGPNGAGKSTIAMLACGLLLPGKGKITGLNNSSSAFCDQITEFPPCRAAEFICNSDNRAGELRSLLGIDND